MLHAVERLASLTTLPDSRLITYQYADSDDTTAVCPSTDNDVLVSLKPGLNGDLPNMGLGVMDASNIPKCIEGTRDSVYLVSRRHQSVTLAFPVILKSFLI